MTTTRNLQLLFDRPSEPIFTVKGEENVTFDVPQSYLSDRFQSIGPGLTNRFGEDASEHVPVQAVGAIDLSEVTQVRRDEKFSIFIPRHARAADALINILMASSDPENLFSTSLYCKDRINAALFNYCLSIAILHRPDTRGVAVPTLVQSFPDRFLDSAVFQQAREEADTVPAPLRRPIVIPLEFTASDLDEEHRCAYWREDIGLNLHHWHWHLVYPFMSSNPTILNKDRRGEVFYYMHQQIQSRYNFERLGNFLQRVKPLNFREPIKEGYYPKLDSLIASRGWAPRQENMVLQDLRREVDGLVVTLDEFELYTKRLYDAIHSGTMMMPSGETVPLNETDGIDVLGNLLEASGLSRNPDYYGNLHNLGHLFIGYVHDPENKYLENIAVMADPATDLRDPVFFRLHAFVDRMFQAYKGTLPRYTTGMLGNPNITLSSVAMTPQGGQPNQLETHWTQSDINLSRGLDFVRGGGLYVRTTHLDHIPFNYTINYNNSGSPKMGTVRIFLAPKFDERGLPWAYRDHRHMFIEMDKFFVQLQSGDNTITRRSDESSVTIPWERTFRNLETGRGNTDEDSFNFCGCGWPQHVLLPRGTQAGMACTLFVMISNYDRDRVEQSLDGVCADAASYCGIKDRLWPDQRSMGYPFDRMGRTGVETLEEFLTPNMAIQDVTIRFSGQTVLNPRNPPANN